MTGRSYAGRMQRDADGGIMGAERLRANEPRVVHETIDGEVIIIDLATGSYYSLSGGAANVWALVIAGYSSGEMVNMLSDAYDEEPDAIQILLEPFLAELQSESLAVAAVDGDMSPDYVSQMNVGGVFSAHMEKHTDMTELILLDPVHDVDSLGWPHLPEDHETHGSKTS